MKTRTMKKLLVCSLLSFLFLTSYAQYGDDRSGYDGDFFSLQGALDLFRESSNLRAFERKLNSEKYWVNNLDLNYDGEIDYVRVEHRQQGNFHAIILQALVDRYEVQDVAVIEIEVLRRGEAILQIIGDEDLYGQEVVVEPVDNYADYRRGYHSQYGDFVNVYYWRPVQNILDRQYRIYASPYRWQSYPSWWAPRICLSWNVFRPRIVIYSTRFHIVRRHRLVRVRDFYRPYRSYCPTVLQRTNTVRVRQGRAPIYRTQASQPRNRNANTSRSRNEVAQNPRSRATQQRQTGSSISRKRSQEAAGKDTRKRSTAEASQRSRSYETTPRTSRNSSPKQRSTEVQRSSRTSSQGRARSTSPQSKTPSRTRSNTSRSSSRSASPNVRSESKPKPSTSRSSQSSARSRSTTPSSSRARQSSGSSNRKVGSSSQSKARRSPASSSKTRSSGSTSRSKSSSSTGRSKSSSTNSRSRKGRGQ